MAQTIGERLKFVRVSKGLTQAELGELVGCTGRVIGACERGDTELSNDMLVNIGVTCRNG